MYPIATPEKGIKKLDGHCGVYYYSSKDDPKNPDRANGIDDDVAIEVVEAFEERCGNSPDRVGAELVEMKKFGGIKSRFDNHFYHLRRRAGSHVALEIIR